MIKSDKNIMDLHRIKTTLNKLFKWKELLKRKSLENKKLKKRIKELETSRDKWKKKSESQDKTITKLKKRT